tara:strand:+ start:162 stop:404 length:243 start_codon:yes stop_codon:yes gene_type:complete
MNKRIGVVLLGCSVGIIAFLNNQNKKFDEIDEKLDHLTKNVVTHDLEEVICEQDLYIDTLLWEIADLSWKLDKYKKKRKR